MIPNWLRSLKKIGWIDRANAAIKGRLQDRHARRMLAWYRARAGEMKISPPEGEALVEALSQRYAATGRIVRPKAKGDLHIFLTYGHWNWETVLPISLAPFGTVTTFEWRSMGYDDTGAGWLQRRNEMNRHMLRAFEEANARRKVDVVVGYLSGQLVSPETLKAMRRVGSVILNFCYDDIIEFPGRMLGGRYASPAAIASEVDLNLTASPDSVVKYAVHGGLAMFWPEAGEPTIHRPYDVPFKYDVSFLGTAYGRRPYFIRELEGRGVQVHCFGPGWPNGPVPPEGVVPLFSRSRINLGSGGIKRAIKTVCLKARDFEIPMSGGLYLTTENPELAMCYDIGREIFIYRDADDCARTIKRLLADPELAAASRAAGRKRALADHTYEVRWTQAFRTAGLLA